MTIFLGDYIPYEYVSRFEVFRYVKSKAQGLKKSIRLVEKDNEHLTVRCPLSGDYLDIVGTTEDLEWLYNELVKGAWFRTT